MTLDWPLSHRPNQLRILCLQLHLLRAGGDYGPNRPFTASLDAAAQPVRAAICASRSIVSAKRWSWT
jgi:hypothetical protein